MTDAELAILQALYELEREQLRVNNTGFWFTPEQVAASLPTSHPNYRDELWAREQLRSLWVAKKVMQVPLHEGPYALEDVVLRGLDAHGSSATYLPVETNDCRGPYAHPWEQVACYESSVPTAYRSRVAEITRLLSLNYQRFRMVPSTGLLRYERRPQYRPHYAVEIDVLVGQLRSAILAGVLTIETSPGSALNFEIDAVVDRSTLSRAVEAVMSALAELFASRGQQARLADFQVRSILATLCGLYSESYRTRFDAHVITAGVGSGKSYAFQVGALIHTAYRALQDQRQMQVLLLYPRVVLAGNQFQDLFTLVELVSAKLGVPLARPVLDAGGQLAAAYGDGGTPVRGQLFRAIREAYQTDRQIVISNLDTLANRLVHPEASPGLLRNLELIVLDEVHILSGLYGAHAKMLLQRLNLMRAVWRLRQMHSQEMMEQLLARVSTVRDAYVVAASATISEPSRHVSRILSGDSKRMLHVEVNAPEERGWVHHLFLRQRPEASSMTAATNAVSCLIHNRRDSLYLEYYQNHVSTDPVRLENIDNPASPSPNTELRQTRFVHKTLGFCDSLDGVGRWADLIADNERTKASSMGVSANPAGADLPYFIRFQEPLWRVVHHLSFGANPPSWQQQLWEHYGTMCRDCKRGVRRRVPRIPTGLRQAQRDGVERLWDMSPDNPDSYLARLGVDAEFFDAPNLAPVREAARAEVIGNLEECGFYRSGLCWWWSRDHLGSNHPCPASGAQPLNGYKKPAASTTGRYHPLNGIRVRSFTSNDAFNASESSINDIFRTTAGRLFRDRDFSPVDANCALVIGSPRIEVGIDLSRVRDGITFRSMRDPASLQQKVGRVGREVNSDSIIVHVVTENARDHFYFRNPRIALDPDYLQPIPLHENNRVIARNHFFMAIVDFLCLQGSGPTEGRLGNDGDRLFLVNDHRYTTPPLANWDRKVRAAYDFLFGSHARVRQNRANVEAYLRLLGARDEDISNEAAAQVLTPERGPGGLPVGAVDVFGHEFGPGFLLTEVSWRERTRTGSATLAQFCSTQYAPPALTSTGLPRHTEFVRSLPQEEPLKNRSYLYQLLTLPVFRRGVPLQDIPGDPPYLWTPNFFEAVGNEYVRVFEDVGGRQRELGYESVSLALALLSPGTVTYRYTPSPRKVPVTQFGAQGLSTRMPALEAVRLDVTNPEYFEPARCPELGVADIPADFPWTGSTVPVYTPKQIGLILASSEPLVSPDGLLADDDSRPLTTPGAMSVATPPRSFPLRWYRVEATDALRRPPCRFSTRFRPPANQRPLPELPLPPVFDLFSDVGYDAQFEVTDYVWGLERQFMTRRVEPARLVYSAGSDGQFSPAVLGRHYQTAGLRFALDLRPGSRLEQFFQELWSRERSGVYQATLGHVLYQFLLEYARNPPAPDAPPWVEAGRASVFTIRNLRTIIYFHLLERWYPAASTVSPAGPPQWTLDDLAGCFNPDHANFLSDDRFVQVCRWIAAVQNPASMSERFDTLLVALTNLRSARERAAELNGTFWRRVAEELLLNTLGLALHGAALRLTGAEASDLSYFYERSDAHGAAIYLFDTDDFGNGTTDLIRDTFHVSAVERILVAKQRALAGSPDPLPTTDFASCLEDILQECDGSHAAHLAFHDLSAGTSCFQDLDSAREGERQAAGAVMDFLRLRLDLNSIDYVIPLQLCPEFLAHASLYARHADSTLVPSPYYPTFQALESAMGFCVNGCVACVVAPEQNVRGVLTARETVSKLLLDAAYRFVVCESEAQVNTLCYPGAGPGRTEQWENLALRVAAAIGQSPAGATALMVELETPRGPMPVTVVPATGAGPWNLVFRPTWQSASPPEPRVRPRMVF